MVRCDLLVVPSLAPEGQIGASHPKGERRQVPTDRMHDLARLPVLPLGQMRAVRARVGRQAMGLIEGLASVEHRLSAQGELSPRVNLQLGERIG